MFAQGYMKYHTLPRRTMLKKKKIIILFIFFWGGGEGGCVRVCGVWVWVGCVGDLYVGVCVGVWGVIYIWYKTRSICAVMIAAWQCVWQERTKVHNYLVFISTLKKETSSLNNLIKSEQSGQISPNTFSFDKQKCKSTQISSVFTLHESTND